MSDDSKDKHQDNDQRQDICHVRSHPGHDFHTFALVGLFNKLIPAPSIAARTENNENERADGQDIIADDEVLKVKYRRSLSQRLEEGPHIKAKRAGEREHEQDDRVVKARLLAAPAKLVHAHCHDVLEHGQHR